MGFLTFFVVTFHVAMSWYDTVPFPETSVATAFYDWFNRININYFMASFFLISAYFCPSSLDRKGFRMFVLDKMVRLGIPFLVMMNALGCPLYSYVMEVIAKQPPVFTVMNTDVAWFIIRLLDFSVLYAVIAQVMPVIKLKMPSPILLSIAGFAFGIIFHALDLFIPDAYQKIWYSNNGWPKELSLYIWFFIAGIIGGRNNWLHSIENMPRRTVWFLRILVAALLPIWLALIILIYTGVVPQPDPMGLGWLIAGFTNGVYPVSMTLMQMQMFYEFFNFTTPFMSALGEAAYGVYIAQFWPLVLCPCAYAEMVHLPDLSTLSMGQIYGGIAFTFFVCHLTLWPSMWALRKLPV